MRVTMNAKPYNRVTAPHRTCSLSQSYTELHFHFSHIKLMT